VLKKRKTQDAIAKQRAADKSAARAAAKTRSQEAFKHAEKYVKEYRAQENDAVRCAARPARTVSSTSRRSPRSRS